MVAYRLYGINILERERERKRERERERESEREREREIIFCFRHEYFFKKGVLIFLL